MNSEKKGRLVWFSVFMIWLGMVSSILVYRTTQVGLTPAQMTPENTIAEVNQQSKPDSIVIERMPENEPTEGQNAANLQMSKAKEENSDKEFFVQYRLERDKARQEQINNYRDMVNNPNTDPSVKKTAQEAMLRLTQHIENEMEIESLIRTRGFKDALAYMHESSIDLIIQTDGLTETEAAKIGDIVTRITDLRVEDITIIEKRITKSQ